MKKSVPAADADAYVAGLTGWRREVVQGLRREVRGAGAEMEGGLEEGIRWGHLVYASGGPVLLIRAEEERVLFGFWRGKRLRELEPGLKPGGKYEMATLELREGGPRPEGERVRRLVREAVALNAALGNPQEAAGTAGREK